MAIASSNSPPEALSPASPPIFVGHCVRPLLRLGGASWEAEKGDVVAQQAMFP